MRPRGLALFLPALLCVVSLSLALCLCAPPAAAQTPQEAGEELKERLTSALEQREQIAESLERARKEIKRLEGEIAAGESDALEMTRQEAEVSDRLPEVRQQQEEMAPRVEALRRRYHRHLRALYLFGPDLSLSLWASATDFHDVLTRTAALTRLLDHEQKARKELMAQSAALADLRAILAYRQNEIQELRRQLGENRNRLLTLKQARQQAMAELAARRKALDENVALLSEAEARLARTFALGEGQDAGDGSVARARGRLSPPVEGRIKGRWGHGQRGVLIEARPGAPVRAPWAGTVVHAASLTGYDRVVVLDHGQRVHTVLANLGTLSVVAGQDVKAGEPVGTLDGSGLLYLELRKGTQPENPLDWLSISP